jgi:hypothetical protein
MIDICPSCKTNLKSGNKTSWYWFIHCGKCGFTVRDKDRTFNSYYEDVCICRDNFHLEYWITNKRANFVKLSGTAFSMMINDITFDSIESMSSMLDTLIMSSEESKIFL